MDMTQLSFAGRDILQIVTAVCDAKDETIPAFSAAEMRKVLKVWSAEVEVCSAWKGIAMGEPSSIAPDARVEEVLEHLDYAIAICKADTVPRATREGGIPIVHGSPYTTVWKSWLERYASTIRLLVASRTVSDAEV